MGNIVITKPKPGALNMPEARLKQSKKQELFQNMFVGILLYTVVIGFFNDYTDILYVKSYSTILLVSVVMQVLTFATFALKDTVKKWFDNKTGKLNTAGLVFSIWLILFLSKFVFLAVIDFIFGELVEFGGFFGIFGIIICLTVLQKTSEFIYGKLGD
jgi:hypothetical protein